MQETTQAASLPAEVADPFQGQAPSMAEYSNYRKTGELPERFKPAATEEPAPSDAPEKTESETAAESETAQTQESQSRRKPNAEERIAQLEATIEKIQQGSGVQSTKDRKIAELEARIAELTPKDAKQAESSTAKVDPMQPVTFDQDKWIKDNPNASYEDMARAMVRHEARELIRIEKLEQAQKQQQQKFADSISDARQKYEDFDAVFAPAIDAVFKDAQIPDVVKEMLDRSPVNVELMYALGNDKDYFEALIKTAKSDPREAIFMVASAEKEVRDFLAGKGTSSDETKEQKTQTPEKKSSSAPKPPEPVTGGSARTFDVTDESLSADEWARKRRADLAKRGK